MTRVRGNLAALARLTRRGLRRTPSHHWVTLLLVTIAAALLNIGVVLATDYPSSTKRTFAELHAEDLLTAVTSPDLARRGEAFLARDPDVTAYDSTPARIVGFAVRDYGGRETIGYAAFHDQDRPPAIGAGRVVEELPERLADGAYVPYAFARGGGYELGDSFTLQLGSTPVTFRVQGLVESPVTGSLLVGIVGFGLPHEGYERFAAQGFAPAAWILRGQVADPDRAGEVQAQLHRDLQAAGAMSDASLMPFTSNRDTVIAGLEATSRLFSALLVIFALLVAVVAAAVIAFHVRSAVVREMPAIGTLKATGFTSGQIMAALVGPHLVAVLAGSLVGVGLSGLLLPGLEDMLASMTGLLWDPGLPPVAALVTVAALVGTCVVVAAGAALRVRAIPPVDALRGGQAAHSFTRNPLPLHRTRGSLPLILGIKQAARRPAQNALVVAVLALVTFTIAFCAAATAYLNEPRRFYDASLGDWGQVWVTPAAGADREALRDRLADEPGVVAAYPDDLMLQASGPTGPVVVRATPDYGVLADDSVIEGRASETADEAAVGSRLAERAGLRIGDRLDLRQGERTAAYLITGISQSSFGLGVNAGLTSDGYARLSPGYRPWVMHLRLVAGTDVGALIERLRSTYAAQTAAVVDSEAYRASTLAAAAEGSRSLGLLFLVVYVVVGVLVVGLVTSAAVLHGRREAGTQKALGFGTGQLTAQLLASQQPQVWAGVLVGLLLARVGTTPLISQAGRLSGVSHLPVQPSAVVLAGVGLGLVVVTAVTTVALGRGLRRVSVQDLVRD